ncbi:MAG: AbrB/MazE/SpoVT family DNA-binding domain-containing protein [Clostridia bacterium]
MMKATGIVRRIDDLGRLVLPIELRRVMGIKVKDYVEIYVDDDSIILKKYAPACLFCGSADDIQIYKGRKVCKKCIDDMSSHLNEE